MHFKMVLHTYSERDARVAQGDGALFNFW